ncbi:MAG: amidohydrolase family protein [Clostridia bacterium]|nr:amidohydrolase family protein [Clostridia bacterium]
MKTIKKIDIHAHARPFEHIAPVYSRGESFVCARELIDFYDKLNIEKGVLLPITSPEYHSFLITSADCAHTAEKHPDRFFWFCSIDPRGCGNRPDANFTPLLEYYKSLGAKGVGELMPQLYFDDPLMDNLFYHCAACDMPVTIDMGTRFGYSYGIVDDIGLPRLEKMLQKHKNLKILGHSAPFWSEISSDVTEETRSSYPKGKVKEGRIAELMRKYENLYCDLSATSGSNAMMRDPEYAASFIEEFADRILYGCDICQIFNTFQFDFDEFLTQMRADGMISEENYYKIVRGNAIKLLKLDEAE